MIRSEIGHISLTSRTDFDLFDEGRELVDDEIQPWWDLLGLAVGDEPFEGKLAVGDRVLLA